MKLFVDDIRQPPDGSWTLATTISSAIDFIERYGLNITHISLDHDISIEVDIHGLNRPYPSPDTFKAVAKYILQYYCDCNLNGNEMYPEMTTHSSNPDGRKAIVSLFDSWGIDCKETPLPIAKR